jgi:fructose-1,6-bisphosphatase/inositol monophosphatase family enzyme
VPRFDYESDDREILGFLHDVADAAADTLDEIADWSLSGEREGQYSADVVIDDVVVDMLEAAGFDVLSEESGAGSFEWPITGDQLLAVIDPLDGSTNASKGLPWFATSICIVDREGLRAALVAEQSGTETRFAAARGMGANCDGIPLRVIPHHDARTAVIGTNGVPPQAHGWWQFRTLGAAALDISLVAKGGLDGYVDYHDHGVWDYLAALLICREAGATVGEAFGRELLVIDPSARRTPIVASSPELFNALAESARIHHHA